MADQMRATLRTDVDAAKTAIDTAFAQANTDYDALTAAQKSSSGCPNEWYIARDELIEYLRSKKR
jgi:hypothetical protein